VVVDAGWYRAGSDPDGELGLVDTVRFPSGMRALVDYAHSHGVAVLLYASAPWVDSRPDLETWWVVQLGFVRDRPHWLITVDADEAGATYVYDLSNLELRRYLRGLIERYLVEYDADGILLDMVGVIGSTSEYLGGQTGASPSYSGAQALDVYRFFWETAQEFKPNAWIEGGYATPPLARSYAHTWRLADDYPGFLHPYPFAGLAEQLEYARLQLQVLGRRPHLGFIFGKPQDSTSIGSGLARRSRSRRRSP